MILGLTTLFLRTEEFQSVGCHFFSDSKFSISGREREVTVYRVGDFWI